MLFLKPKSVKIEYLLKFAVYVIRRFYNVNMGMYMCIGTYLNKNLDFFVTNRMLTLLKIST